MINMDLAWKSGVRQAEAKRAKRGHDLVVADVVVTPDNHRIISAGTEGLKVWDYQTGGLIHDIPSPAGSLYSITMLPDNTHVAVIYHHYASSESVIWIADIQTGLEAWQSPRMAQLGNEVIAISQNEIAYTQGNDIYFWRWQTETNPSLAASNLVSPSKIRITPDRQKILFVDGNNNLRVLDVESKQLTRDIPGYVDAIPHPDSTRALCKTIDGQLRVIDLQSDQVLQTFAEGGGACDADTPMGITPDGQFAITGQERDAAIGVWNINTGQLTHTLPGHKESIRGLTITADSKRVITAGGADKTVKVWDLQTRECLFTLPGDYSYWYPVTVTPDNQHAISPSNLDGRVLGMWNLINGNLVKSFIAHESSVTSLALTPNGRYLASASRDATVRVWDMETAQLLHTLRHSQPVILLAVTKDGRRIISVETSGILRVWDLETGKFLSALDNNRGYRDVRYLNVSPDNRYAVTSSRDGAEEKPKLGQFEFTLTVWDLDEAKVKYIFTSRHYFEWDIRAAAFTQDSRYLICASSMMIVYTLDLHTGELTQTFLDPDKNKRRPNMLEAITIIPERRRLAAYKAEDGFKIFDLETMTVTGSDANKSHLHHSRLSADHSRMAVVSQLNYDQWADIWNLETEIVIARYRFAGMDRDTFNIIKDAAIAPDNGTILVTDSFGVLYCLRTDLMYTEHG